MTMDLLDLQKLLQNFGVLISFSGRFTQEIIEELGGAVKKYLETEATSQNDTYNVFAVFIEQTQNIKNYSSLQSSSLAGERIANSGIVAIGKSEEGYFVSSGNLVATGDVALLAARLDEIASLDKTGLKKLYKEQLKKEIPPGCSGAGLGLIDMARRASKPLHYSVVPLDETISFFTLKAYV
ncbi:SiaB family protein kinase [Sporomusa aerivorans]|uniref:SiaB family protein kinase n=1 Tax=Sporomusa aerivorans TaxID=204936 RepID=UPI00352A48D6